MNIQTFLRRLHFPFVLIFGLLPLPLLLICRLSAQPHALVWFFTLACMFPCMLCVLVPGRFRPAAAVLCAVLLFAAVLPAAATHAQPALLLLPAAAVVFLFASLPLAARELHEVSLVLYCIGVISHIAVQIILLFSFHSGSTVYQPIAALTYVLFLAYALMFLLAFNRISMDNATLARFHLPASMRRINLTLTLGFFSGCLFLSLLPAAADALRAAYRFLRSALMQIAAMLLRLFPAEDSYGGPGMGGPVYLPDTGAAYEPTLLSVIIDRIAAAAAFLLIIIGTAFLLRFLGRLAFKALRKLIARLYRLSSALSEDYVDEISDTRSENGTERRTELNLLKKAKAEMYPDTPQGAVRRSYARLLRRNPGWSKNSTARENLNLRAASIYEKARYSTHAVTQEEADQFLRASDTPYTKQEQP